MFLCLGHHTAPSTSEVPTHGAPVPFLLSSILTPEPWLCGQGLFFLDIVSSFPLFHYMCFCLCMFCFLILKGKCSKVVCKHSPTLSQMRSFTEYVEKSSKQCPTLQRIFFLHSSIYSHSSSLPALQLTFYGKHSPFVFSY